MRVARRLDVTDNEGAPRHLDIYEVWPPVHLPHVSVRYMAMGRFGNRTMAWWSDPLGEQLFDVRFDVTPNVEAFFSNLFSP